MRKFWKDKSYPSSLGSKKQTITGILNPIQWDRDGKIKKFSIYSNDEEDFIIIGFNNHKKLRGLLNKKVKARGHIRSSKDGSKRIMLTSIYALPTMRAKKPNNLGMYNEEFQINIPDNYYDNLNGGYWETC